MSNLTSVFEELKRDLVNPGGPSITTMRNYSFAILVYRPEQEFEARKKVRQLSDQLRGEQWAVLEISLQRLLLKRLRDLQQGFAAPDHQQAVARDRFARIRRDERAAPAGAPPVDSAVAKNF